ncbi:MAG: mannitol dehydrogenase family protein [Alphaproteobacteria bacterium]|nr:mannitol dehydrogenase family protein [Alphaproteobacteria bacterium]
MARLKEALLTQLPDHVARPNFNRDAVDIGIVHLGVGAFHRAHLASYVDRCLADDPAWGICGVSLRSPATKHALAPQDGLYTLGVQSSEGLQPRVIGALKQVIVAADEPDALAHRLANESTRIVSLTVTEKGYCYNPADRRLDTANPDIVHDLETAGSPRTAIGWLCHGLIARLDLGRAPYTILSCDNLPENGATLRQVLADFIELKRPDLSDWFANEVACPSTMVDRIVPATTEEDRALISKTIGADDAWPVMAEPFSQFVVEEHFPLGRPDWEKHGVTMTDDVGPYENMKLRMLNGGHSTLAYLGYLAGYETVAQVIADTDMRTFIHDMMAEEIAPTLAMPDGVDLDAYRDALLSRFSNTALKHRTWQIAMDGSQKLPQRLLNTIRDRLGAGQSFERLALGVAGWMTYALGTDETGEPIDVRDPLNQAFQAIARTTNGATTELVSQFLALKSVFGDDLSQDPVFRTSMVQALDLLRTLGAQQSVLRHVR